MTVEKKVSKYPEKFGTGVIEGVGSVEAANNATAQTGFIPLLVPSAFPRGRRWRSSWTAFDDVWTATRADAFPTQQNLCLDSNREHVRR